MKSFSVKRVFSVFLFLAYTNLAHAQPTVVITTEFNLYKDKAPVLVDLHFDKIIDPVSFTKEDISITSGYVNSLSGSGQDYVANVTPLIEEGVFYVSMAESSVFDTSGKGNKVSDTLMIAYDSSPMYAEIVIEYLKKYIGTSSFDARLAFSDVVTGIEKKDFIVTNGRVAYIHQAEDHYLVNIESLYEETIIEISLPYGAAKNENEVPTPELYLRVLVDSTKPKVILESEVDEPTSSNIPVTIRIDDPVHDFFIDPIYCIAFDSYCFNLEDITISGGRITDFRRTDYGIYDFEIIPFNKYIDVSIPQNVFINITDLGNIESNHLHFEYLNGKVILDVEKENLGAIRDWVDYNNELHIEINDGTGRGELMLMDYSGKLIKELEIPRSPFQMSLDELSAGIYLIRVRTLESQYHSKIKISNQ